MIKTKSVHAPASPDDGKRYLVELFWPEGVHTRSAEVDEWRRELGPSYDLQRFEFDKSNWEQYKRMYREELHATPEKHMLLQKIAREAREGTVTLLYGNQDPQHNHAVILKELVEKGL